jgi:Zn-dependent protease
MPSKIELRDLIVSVIVLSLAFSKFNLAEFPMMLVIIVLVFVLHEMAHRYVARSYGCFAEYRMWPLGLLLALLSSFTGIIFAAPGATYISPYTRKKFAFSVVHLTKKEYGKISLAGPITNIVVGLAALLLIFAYPLDLFLTLAEISFFLAFFNLLPIFPLDGSKVMTWNMKIWLTAFAISLIGVISLSLI